MGVSSLLNTIKYYSNIAFASNRHYLGDGLPCVQNFNIGSKKYFLNISVYSVLCSTKCIIIYMICITIYIIYRFLVRLCTKRFGIDTYLGCWSLSNSVFGWGLSFEVYMRWLLDYKFFSSFPIIWPTKIIYELLSIPFPNIHKCRNRTYFIIRGKCYKDCAIFSSCIYWVLFSKGMV